MRYFGLAAAAAGIMALAACGGAKQQSADTTSTAAVAPADSTSATTPAAATSTVAAAPITGKTYDVKMIGDDKGYRFEPADITIKSGDAIRYINVSGGPHNVAVDPTSLSPDVKAQLSANMPSQSSDMTSPLLSAPNESYTISFGKVPAGTYNVHCPLHLAMNMKQTVTVQ